MEQPNYAASFGFQWHRFSKTQLDSFSGTTHSRDRLLTETGWPTESFKGRLILDAGCGTGRFAEVAASLGATVVALDYSSAIEVCAANLKDLPNVLYVRGDLANLPFPSGAFDACYLLGVLQHTSHPRQVVMELARCVRPRGRLAITAYSRHWKARLQAKYFLRPITKRVEPRALLNFLGWWIPKAILVNRSLRRMLRLPINVVNNLTVCYYYENLIPLSRDQLVDWAILDTFDALSPQYDQPQSFHDLRRRLMSAGFSEVAQTVPRSACLSAIKD
jgi:2-polyprenyl-3-methyl-5-hydroxy-6-metoxy-1,4-benzoquinol methylase